jgi:peptide/nickel transport system substrate-binding protein
VVRSYSRREALRLAAAFGVVVGATSIGACGDDVPSVEEEDLGLGLVPLEQRAVRELHAPAGRLRLGTLKTVPTASQPLSVIEQLLVYSRLVAVDPRTATIHGDLAAAIEVVSPLEVRFQLQAGVFFHPDQDSLAQPVSALAVRRSFEEQAAAGVPLFRDIIESVEAPDAGNVVLRLRGPFAFLFELLAAPEASVRSEVGYPGFRDPIGSGLFIPSGQDRTGHVLLANERHHHQGYPQLQQINMLQFADEREIDGAFQALRIDAREHPDVTSVEFASERTDATQQRRPARSLIGLGLSLLPSKGGAPTGYVEAFQDERVRRAVSHALDRDAIAEAAGGTVASPVGAAHAADSLTADELSTHPFQRFDPAESTALMAATGLEQVSFRLQVADDPALRDVAELVQRQLAMAGFAVELRAEPVDAWERSFAAGDFEATVFQAGGLSTPDIGLRLHSSGGLDGEFSPWGYSNPVFDAALKAALSELRPDRRAELMREAQRVLLGEVPAMLPLVTPYDVASLGPNVVGYAFNAFEFNSAWLAGQWERRT